MLMSNTKSFEPKYHEPYMSPRQLKYFKGKLLAWRTELEDANRQSFVMMNHSDMRPIEEMERSIVSMNLELSIMAQTRNWRLIHMIDMALERIDAGTYGYCEATDDPIGLGRLEANPVALYCLALHRTEN